MISYRPSAELAGPLYGKDPWPLRFFTHKFDAVCLNTLTCSIVYNARQFGTRTKDIDGYLDHPSGAPKNDSWKDQWVGHHLVVPDDGRTFPGPVLLEWTSLDGVAHEDSIDLDSLFESRIILHHVPRHEVAEAWLESCSISPVAPSILLEVNDRKVSVYMRATVVTNSETIEGNPNSRSRRDLILAWERHAFVMNVDSIPSL